MEQVVILSFKKKKKSNTLNSPAQHQMVEIKG